RLNKVALKAKRGAAREEVPAADKIAARDSTVEVSGFLRKADSLKEGRSEIVILSEDGARHKVVVLPGMMSDIVKPLWETRVVVKGGDVLRVVEI
ncbi:MAG TPA: hypothetical protein VKQ30_18220, partial [Ktedonobacterales bacterium]|nr:hypothetical protein [Ktedonobacterales bacterium]